MQEKAPRLAVRFKAGLLFAAGIAVLLLAIFDGLDRYAVHDPGIERLVPEPLRARSERALSARAFMLGDGDSAASHAAAAVARDPMERRNLGLLGVSQLEAGDRAGAEAAFRQASALGWREPLTQLFWFEASLRAADLPRAMARLDALLRNDPKSAEAQRALAMVASIGAGRAELARLLSKRPGWMRAVLEAPASLPDSRLLDRAAIMVRLGESGTVLGCDAPRALTQAVLERGDYDAARQVWGLHCPQQAAGERFADPAFVSLKDGGVAGPFGWQRIASGDIDVRTGSGGEVMVRNTASRMRVVAIQPVLLAPGELRVRLRDGASGAFGFAVQCGKQQPTSKSAQQGDPASGGQTIQVPSCRNQWLALYANPSAQDAALGTLLID